MIHDNDRTIFEYLNPTSNEMLSKINSKELSELLFYINRYYLEYRDSLGIDSDISFGMEFEIENFKDGPSGHWPFQLKLNEIVGNDRWISKNDITLYNGREVASEILFDCNETWRKISDVCDFISGYGEIDYTCASQIHIGSQILGDNSLYWYRFFKLWSIYENVIYRFSYGEYLTHRNNICRNARPAAQFLNSRMNVMEERIGSSLNDMLYSIKPGDMSFDVLKQYGISFWHMLADENYDMFENFNQINNGCTIEFKCPNGTLDRVIWQNELLFDVSLMLYCKSDSFDEDILNKRKIEVSGIFSEIGAYSLIYLEQALELCDMIFDNNKDKIYFLRQYLKSFEVTSQVFVKARKFTMS